MLGPNPDYFRTSAERDRAAVAVERSALFLDKESDRDAVMERFQRLYPPKSRKKREEE